MVERKLRSDRYSENGELKKCSGFLHRENPVMLPLIQFHILKSGRHTGKPMSECIECWRARAGRVPENGWVSRHEWEPVLRKLIQILGSKAEIARRVDQNRGFFSRPRDKMRAPQFRQLEQLLTTLEKELGTQRRGGGEAHVVDSEPIQTILLKFFRDWVKERPLHHRTFREDEEIGYSAMQEDFYGPWEWLAEKTQINIRRITAFSRGEIQRIPLSQADEILTALNLTHLIDGINATIEIKPNPQWSMESYLNYMRDRGCI